MAVYESTSPWHSTRIKQNQYLDVLQIRPIPAEDDDILYTVQPQYAYRPDLLHTTCTELKSSGGYFLNAIWTF